MNLKCIIKVMNQKRATKYAALQLNQ